MSKTIIKTEVQSGPFLTLLTVLTSKTMRLVETKEDNEKAMTVRFSPTIAERLDSYAKAARMSRSLLIRMLLEGALDEMDEIIIKETERREEEDSLMSMQFEELEKARIEKANRAKAVLEKWQEK
jgi:predicted DNA-binding protein